MKPIGKMDSEVILQSLVETNNSGQLEQTWTTVDTVWAEVLTEHGSEALEAARQNAKETIRVRMHYRDDVVTSWRVQWMGQNYYVQAVDRSGKRSGELWVTAMAVGVN